MLIDRKGRLFGKISIADLVVIAVVFALLLGLVFRFNKSNVNNPFTASDNIRITFYAENITEFNASLLKKGDAVKDKDTNTVFGQVADIIVGDSVIYRFNPDGKLVSTSQPDNKSVTIVVEGEGKYSDTAGAHFGNTEYFLNSTIANLQVGRITLRTRIDTIDKI